MGSPINEERLALGRLIVRLDTLQRDSQRQIDDLKERVRVLEEDAGIKTAIDWDRAFNAGPQGQER